MPIRVVPVLDLKGGCAVRARAGDRAHYAPLRGVLHPDSDPLGWALAFRQRLGLSDLYVADLDAIVAGAPQHDLLAGLESCGMDLWLDAGLRDEVTLRPFLPRRIATLVVGLETLRGPDSLARMIDDAGPDRLIFSLDLRDGRPLGDLAGWGVDRPEALIDRAVALGIARVLILDLVRVGVGGGLGTLELLGVLRRSHPEVSWTLGGGVSGIADLEGLDGRGASSVLVGSALYDGTIGREELAGLASDPPDGRARG